MVWWRTGNGVNCTKEGKIVTWHSLKSCLTDNPGYFMHCFARQTKKNKFVNEENNLYQDLVVSHKATMLQCLHLSQVKNVQPFWFLWFLCPCHKVATNSFLDFFLNDCRYWVILCFGPLHWYLTKFVNSKGFFLNDWGCSSYLLYIHVSVSWCFRGKEGGICVWKAFGVAEGTRMLQFNYLFWGYIGITLSVCSPFRPSMYLVNATPPNPFNGFWWNFMKVGHHM
jgi:hypothetical protein